ncbi:uncharacterized protein LOC122251847 [Penaeus japonicus]|uniref:uncharacterized protein LOC122251847 n=1 Tax=Penaeus japonicus TaxID=27405 RepID=UPI001C70F5BC|nr:uncharacterized protein LOC122251847 [Penaeus japonicus]
MAVIKRLRALSAVFLCVSVGLSGAQDIVRAHQLPLEDLPLIFLPVSRARKLSVVPAVPRRYTVTPMRPLPFEAAGKAPPEGHASPNSVVGGTAVPTTEPGRAHVGGVVRAPFSTSVVTTSSSTSFSSPSNPHPTSPPAGATGGVTKVLVTPGTKHSAPTGLPNHIRGSATAAPLPAFFSKPTIRRGSTIATIRFRVPDRKPSRSPDGNVFPALIGFVHRPSRRSANEAEAHALGRHLGASPIGLLYSLW